MTQKIIDLSNFKTLLLNQVPIIDVRAPIEFVTGSIPGSINIPILSNEERHEVGTVYKKQGQDAAIRVGHNLVSGQIKDFRIQQWSDFKKLNSSAVITCFRGGLRSKTAQGWLSDKGIEIPRIDGGYKAVRKYLIQQLNDLSAAPMHVISGNSGAGKTLLIQEVRKFRPTIDLEFLAKHRGSAFGAYDQPQPSQADFENTLALELIKQSASSKNLALVIEDESRMIGSCSQPEKFFDSLRASSLILLEEPLSKRVDTLFNEYIINIPKGKKPEAFNRYKKSFQIISKKLGGLRFQEIMNDLDLAITQTLESDNSEKHKVWIEKLLVWYYDPSYVKSLKIRNPKILFKGSRAEALQFFTSI